MWCTGLCNIYSWHVTHCSMLQPRQHLLLTRNPLFNAAVLATSTLDMGSIVQSCSLRNIYSWYGTHCSMLQSQQRLILTCHPLFNAAASATSTLDMQPTVQCCSLGNIYSWHATHCSILQSPQHLLLTWTHCSMLQSQQHLILTCDPLFNAAVSVTSNLDMISNIRYNNQFKTPLINYNEANDAIMFVTDRRSVAEW